jgi:hypothetical protein
MAIRTQEGTYQKKEEEGKLAGFKNDNIKNYEIIRQLFLRGHNESMRRSERIFNIQKADIHLYNTNKTSPTSYAC